MGTSTGVRFALHDTLEREDTDVIEDKSPPVSATTDDGTTRAVASTSNTASHVQQTQQSLEQLPQQILTQIRSIQQYMQLIGDLDGRSTDSGKVVDETLWSLVDDVMGGRKLTEYTKMDIMKDGESRQVRGLGRFTTVSGCRADFFFLISTIQTLMMLGIERESNDFWWTMC